MKTRRVGTLTCGAALVAVGALFLINTVAPKLIDLHMALAFWPVILIFLGIEVLCSAFADSGKVVIKFDFVSVVLMFVSLLGAFACEAARLCMERAW